MKNAPDKETISNDRQNSPNNLEFLKLLPANAKVIVEIGCGTGLLAQEYQRINPHCTYIGIEENPEMAQIARDRVSLVFLNDRKTIDFAHLGIEKESIDCLIYGDQIPFFDFPETTLKKHQPWLSASGVVFAKIPNMQHWGKIVNLLRGQWEIVEGEKSQAFTLDTIKTLFAQADLQIYELLARGQKPESYLQFQQLFQPLLPTLGIDPQNFANQTGAEYYIVKAIKDKTPPRRLLIQTAIMAPTGCDRVRVLEPDQLSSTIPGVRTFSTVKSLELTPSLPGEEKVFIFQRMIMSYPADLAKLKYLRDNDYLIVAEIDDNPLRRKEYAENKYLSYRGCHCVQTSTESLAEFLRKLNPNVAVFSNQLGFLPPPRPPEDNNFVTLFFGALNREKDWEPIINTLNKILKKHSHRVKVKVIHDRVFFEALEIPQKEFEPFCNYERYQEIMHSCDIGLLPLIPNPVNEMKSDLKFIECAGHSLACLASQTVYGQSIIEGKTGLIYRSIDDFGAKLDTLITNTKFRQEMGDNAYQWVKENRLLCQHYQQRRDWYLQMRDELPRLNQELRDRFPELS